MRLAAAGVGSWIVIQAVINIGARPRPPADHRGPAAAGVLRRLVARPDARGARHADGLRQGRARRATRAAPQEHRPVAATALTCTSSSRRAARAVTSNRRSTSATHSSDWIRRSRSRSSAATAAWRPRSCRPAATSWSPCPASRCHVVPAATWSSSARGSAPPSGVPRPSCGSGRSTSSSASAGTRPSRRTWRRAAPARRSSSTRRTPAPGSRTGWGPGSPRTCTPPSRTRCPARARWPCRCGTRSRRSTGRPCGARRGPTSA